MDQAHYVAHRNLLDKCAKVDLYKAYKAGNLTKALSAAARGSKDVALPSYNDRDEDVAGTLYDKALAETIEAVEKGFADIDGLLTHDLNWMPQDATLSVDKAYFVGYTSDTQAPVTDLVSAQTTSARLDISVLNLTMTVSSALPSSYLPMIQVSLKKTTKGGK